MAETIHFFTFIRNFFHRLGIHPPEQYNNHLYNWRNLFILLCLTTFFILSTAFLILKSGTAEEFVSSFYVSNADLLYLIFWTMIINRMGDLFILMEKIDEFVAKSI